MDSNHTFSCPVRCGDPSLNSAGPVNPRHTLQLRLNFQLRLGKLGLDNILPTIPNISHSNRIDRRLPKPPRPIRSLRIISHTGPRVLRGLEQHGVSFNRMVVGLRLQTFWNMEHWPAIRVEYHHPISDNMFLGMEESA